MDEGALWTVDAAGEGFVLIEGLNGAAGGTEQSPSVIIAEKRGAAAVGAETRGGHGIGKKLKAFDSISMAIREFWRECGDTETGVIDIKMRRIDLNVKS